jgi:predicted GIY-YIG superfamily endonuclease
MVRVPAAQQLLFPDPRPMVERLGRDFFRQLPEGPGVYLMRDANEAVLYIGKAKNLRQRLGSYRVANPDRMPRRHLRLLRAVSRIELQECSDEASALARESELLRTVRPKFNRVGTWPGPPRFFGWRCFEGELRLAVAEAPDADWRWHGPLGWRAFTLRAVLGRLIWVAVHPRSGFSGLPFGWSRETRNRETAISCGGMIEPVAAILEKLLAGEMTEFQDWVRDRLPGDVHVFDRASVAADLELLTEALPSPAPTAPTTMAEKA